MDFAIQLKAWFFPSVLMMTEHRDIYLRIPAVVSTL